MTVRERTICHSAYIFFFVVLSAYILQDSVIGKTASARRADIHASNNKQSQVGQERTLALSVLLMHMRMDDYVRLLMNQMVIENLHASLFLIIRTGASV